MAKYLEKITMKVSDFVRFFATEHLSLPLECAARVCWLELGKINKRQTERLDGNFEDRDTDEKQRFSGLNFLFFVAKTYQS